VDDQIEKSADFGAELVAFWGGGGAHGAMIS